MGATHCCRAPQDFVFLCWRQWFSPHGTTGVRRQMRGAPLQPSPCLWLLLIFLQRVHPLARGPQRVWLVHGTEGSGPALLGLGVPLTFADAPGHGVGLGARSEV